MTKVEEYLQKTGQSMTELCQGASQVGLDHILSELVPEALEKNKKIVWVPENEQLGSGHYELKDVQ